MNTVNTNVKIIPLISVAILLAGQTVMRGDTPEATGLVPASQSLRNDHGLAFAFRFDPPPPAQSTDGDQAARPAALEESQANEQMAEAPVAPVAPEAPEAPEPPNAAWEFKQAKEATWLGLAAKESPEVVSAQLGLKAGEGLTVTLVVPGSPAAKAGFQKNDVLDQIDGQMLVHPMQLRKLVRMHAVGDSITVTYYRGGKKLEAAIKLAKTSSDEASGIESDSFAPAMENFKLKMDNLGSRLHRMDDSLSRAGLSKAELDTELKRAMENASRAVEEAMRKENSAGRDLAAIDRDLAKLARDGVDVGRDAVVTVRNSSNSTKSIVQTDDTGTIIIEAGAKTHLTVRDKNGKVLFDGNISTSAEQKKVPKEVWLKVKPMVEQLH